MDPQAISPTIMVVGVIAAIFMLVVSIMAFLLPLFVFKIRNQVIKMNGKLDELIEILSRSGSSSFKM
jgi:hypothetical protein